PAELPRSAVLTRADVDPDSGQGDRSELADLQGGAEGMREGPAGRFDGDKRSMTRRAVLAGAVVLVAAGGVAAALTFDGSSPAGTSIDNTSATQLATVRRQTLSSQTQVSATLGYAGSGTVVAASGPGGIYTQLPKAGQIVRMGHPLYWVDGKPVILLYGSVTPWRPFHSGMSSGPDVEELNE